MNLSDNIVGNQWSRWASLFIMLSLFPNPNASAQDADSLFDKSSKTFVLLPIINNNPVMKTGFGAMGMYFFKPDPEDNDSPPSVVNLFGLYSINKSYIFAPMVRLFWDQDKNRVFASSALLRINNDFDYEFDDIPLRLVFSELRSVITLEYSRKITGNFYLGILYLGNRTKYLFDQGTEEENDFTREFFEKNGIDDNFISSLGINFSFDNRDYPYYPTKGFNISIKPKLNAGWLGSDNDYVDTDFSLRYYLPIAGNQVLAFSVAGGFASGDVPFDGYQSYGVRNNLRGYPAGKYKGRNMIASQVEYRWRFYKRWGAVAFAGSGSVWGNENNGEETFERTWLPNLGTGLRFMVSQEKKINMRLDYAWGVDGNQGIYFGVMEAF